MNVILLRVVCVWVLRSQRAASAAPDINPSLFPETSSPLPHVTSGNL